MVSLVNTVSNGFPIIMLPFWNFTVIQHGFGLSMQQSSEIGKCRYSFLHNRDNMWKTLSWHRRPFQVRLLHVSSDKYTQQATKRHSRKKSTTEAFRLPNLIWILHILIFFRMINYSKEKKIEYLFSETVSDISYKGILVL